MRGALSTCRDDGCDDDENESECAGCDSQGLEDGVVGGHVVRGVWGYGENGMSGLRSGGFQGQLIQPTTEPLNSSFISMMLLSGSFVSWIGIHPFIES